MSLIIASIKFNLIPLILSVEEYFLQILSILLIILIVLVIVLIRERRKIHSTLKRTVIESSAIEKLNATVIQQSPIGISIRDNNGRLLQYNDAWYNFWHITDENLSDYLERERLELKFDNRDDYLSKWHSEVENVYKNGGQFHIPEIKVVDNKKNEKWISHYFYAITDENNNVERVVILTEDITERKQTEMDLARERNTLNNIIELNPYPISISLADGHFSKGNKAFIDLFKIPPPPEYNFYQDPIVNKLFDVHEIGEKLSKGESVSIPAINYNTHLIDPSYPDNPLTIETKMFPILDTHNNLEYIVSMFADITERTKALANLKESEEKFRSFAENTPAAIFIHTDGRVKYVNPEALRLCGYTQDELQKKSLYDIFSPENAAIIKQKGDLRMTGADIPSYEIPIQHKDGHEVWIIVTGGIIEYQGEKSILGTAFDITPKKKAEQELFRIQKERYSQIREIAGGVAHEIYNSLFPAVSSIEKLKQRLADKNSDEIERNLKLINLTDKAVSRAIHMTELVTEFSRLETQQEREKVNFENYIGGYIETFKYEHDVDDIIFNKSIDLDIVLHINIHHLHSLIYNIMSNAVDSFESGEKVIEIKGKRNLEFYQISISNNGTPIPEDIRDKIFDPFYSTKPKSGTGLGLAICKKIIEIYKGELTLQATIDNKTEFVILFPVEPY